MQQGFTFPAATVIVIVISTIRMLPLNHVIIVLQMPVVFSNIIIITISACIQTRILGNIEGFTHHHHWLLQLRPDKLGLLLLLLHMMIVIVELLLILVISATVVVVASIGSVGSIIMAILTDIRQTTIGNEIRLFVILLIAMC